MPMLRRLSFGVVLAATWATALAAPPLPPETPRSHQSYYVPMRDDVRIALSVWFPGGAPPTKPTSTIFVQTRYGRAGVFRGGYANEYRPYLERGYVVAIADTRGSTASFGPRTVDLGPDQVRDMDELIAHLASQAWSNGSVFVTGVSYMADAADIATSRAAPALKGGVIRETDFDVWAHLFFPGGVRNDWFLDTWGEATYRMDLGQSVDPELGLDCRSRASDCPKLWPMLQPVDEDPDYVLLRQALGQKQRWTPQTYARTEYRDDVAANGYPLFASSPAAHIEGIRRRAAPVQYWGSWMDGGTAEAALARFRSVPHSPMEVWITANSHPNTVGADPFFPEDRAPRPAVADQIEQMTSFLARLERGEKIQRRIHYYVLGTGQFLETTQWPPVDAKQTFWAISPGRSLDVRPPKRSSQDVYDVDFTATTGENTRWSTQFRAPPAYRDRRHEDRKLLTYDTSPFEEDMELVGTPVLRLQIATRTSDPAIHAYLEDVSPEGVVTYLTEGIFRLANRRLADPTTLPYDPGPAPHSYLRADAQPMTPGKFERVEFAFFPVAARIAAGHRLRVAIAGTDAGIFRRYPPVGDESFTIRSGPDDPSGISVTTRRWKEKRRADRE